MILLSFILILTACGNKENNSNASPSASQPPASESASPSATDTASAANETRTFKHVLGETTITGTPKRVVVLEWTHAEDVLALGVQPVGIADIENMKKWVRLPVAIDSAVVDLGDRSTPNMEMLASLKPDLIIGTKFNLEKTYDTFSKIAPTLVYDAYPQEGQGDQYEEMVNTFNQIADVLGKKPEAEAVLLNLDKAYETAKAKVAATGKDKIPFVLAMAYSNQNAVTFRLSTDNSMAVKILEHIGLTNAHKSTKFENYGFTTTDVEALPAVQDANFLHMIQESDNVIENQLKDNSVWKGLNFVKENRVYALGGDMWPYGGPLSAQIMAEKTAELLTK
ncbi:ABC transporter substrate-binding protein [Cohnella silvisoli]|nr:iron-siderophore ABC transporter substrate-binding protein [Cohnella silvisoli]